MLRGERGHRNIDIRPSFLYGTWWSLSIPLLMPPIFILSVASCHTPLQRHRQRNIPPIYGDERLVLCRSLSSLSGSLVQLFCVSFSGVLWMSNYLPGLTAIPRLRA